MNMRYSEGEYNHGKQSWDFLLLAWDGNGAVDNPVTYFYREHKEGIDTTIRNCTKGKEYFWQLEYL